MGVAHAGQPIKVPEDYATIQAAVEAAAPGDKILIGPGEYNENVVIDVYGVQLIAREGLHTVIIDGTDLGVPGSGVDGIHVMADGVVLKHLVVRNFNAYVGPGVVDFRVGILVGDSEDCEIKENLAYLNGDGIVLRDSSDCKVKDNIARNNIHNGFFLRNESHDNEVKDNVALDNGPDMNPAPDFVPAGVGCGIQLSFKSNDNDLEGNSLSGNGRGLQFDRGSTANGAKKNVSTNNSRFGIAALAVGGQPAASGNTIKNNTVLANGEFDLIDQGFPPAVGNEWKNNTFETSNF
jgi:parallel beta-helix repeat protein